LKGTGREMASSEELDPETDSDTFDSEESCQHESRVLDNSCQNRIKKTYHHYHKSSHPRSSTTNTVPQVSKSRRIMKRSKDSSENESEVIKRLKAIEKKISSIEGRISSIESDMGNMREDIRSDMDNMREDIRRIENKINHLYEPVQARHVEKWAQEVWQFDAVEGVASYNFSERESDYLRNCFANVTNKLQNNGAYKKFYNCVFGKKLSSITEQEVNLFSRCYRRSAPNWQLVGDVSTERSITETLIWNAILLVEVTTTELPTGFSNEFKVLIGDMNFRSLKTLLKEQAHFKEKALLSKLLQMERQVLLLRTYYKLRDCQNVFLILSSPSWTQTIPRTKTAGDELLQTLFRRGNTFKMAFKNLNGVYENNNFIARGI
jgi:hypothetical protein